MDDGVYSAVTVDVVPGIMGGVIATVTDGEPEDA